MSTLKANYWQSTTGIPYNKLIQHKSYNATNEVAVISNPNGQYTSTSLSVTITAKRTNSTFFVMADTQGYISANSGNGWNIALVRTISGVQTFIAGTQGPIPAGGPGDAWMGLYHGSGLGANSYARCRTAVDKPNVPMDTDITYNVWIGGWTSTGTMYLGYNGYGNYDTRITVFEFMGE